jgi:ubiquitin-protein ligase
MTDPREIRNRRLNNEGRELQQLSSMGQVIQITPIGNAPYERYNIVFNIRTIISPAPTYRDRTVCTLTIPKNYPDEYPIIMAEQTPYPWHVNWFSSGRWCHGGWNREESLVNFIHRCARTLQFDPEIVNVDSAANTAAIDFWKANKRNRNVIPCDTQVLPILGAPETITINNSAKPQITIKPKTGSPQINIIRRD